MDLGRTDAPLGCMDRAAHIGMQLRIEVRRRLVHQALRRIGHPRAPRLPARALLRAPVEQHRGANCSLGTWHAAGIEAEDDVLDQREMRERRLVLAQLPTQRRWPPPWVAPEQAACAAAGPSGGATPQGTGMVAVAGAAGLTSHNCGPTGKPSSKSRSSRGLGHQPFTLAARVRIPYGTPSPQPRKLILLNFYLSPLLRPHN